MLESAMTAIVIMLDPTRLAILIMGVLIGLAIGAIPGLGGVVGLAMLMPFTLGMDQYSAFALLLGMGSVVTTSDTLPAILFGVPGTGGAAATVMDGLAMSKKGEAGRALGASYSSALLGGLFGALFLGISIPVLRPVMLKLGSPEMLMFCFFGLAMVSVLSGDAPLKGLVSAGLGVMLSLIGSDPVSGILRWTFDKTYLFDGLPIVPYTLGVFAVAEMADFAIARTPIAGNNKYGMQGGAFAGIKNTLSNWWLVLRCSAVGAFLGAMPGIGGSIIDWIAYGHAAQTVKNAENFGKGDVRGIIAVDCAVNAKEGGALVPTIAFGVPGSVSMTLLLGAFVMHGLVPGPQMLSTKLDVTYSLIWSVALANIFAVAILLWFSNFFAKVALIRAGILVPCVLAIVFIGAFAGTHHWGDIYVLIGFGLFGWLMKRFDWPRPPMILGFVLGGIIERYLFVSIGRFGMGWVTRPVVIVTFILILVAFCRPLLVNIRSVRQGKYTLNWKRPLIDYSTIFSLFIIAVISAALFMSVEWQYAAKVIPLSIGFPTLILAVASMLIQIFFAQRSEDENIASTGRTIGNLEPKEMAKRAVNYFGWLVSFILIAKAIGFLPSIFLYLFLYIKFQGEESWKAASAISAGMILFCWIVFDQIIHIPWPQSLLGYFFPSIDLWSLF
jgi:TctA family transporter